MEIERERERVVIITLSLFFFFYYLIIKKSESSKNLVDRLALLIIPMYFRWTSWKRSTRD